MFLNTLRGLDFFASLLLIILERPVKYQHLRDIENLPDDVGQLKHMGWDVNSMFLGERLHELGPWGRVILDREGRAFKLERVVSELLNPAGSCCGNRLGTEGRVVVHGLLILLATDYDLVTGERLCG